MNSHRNLPRSAIIPGHTDSPIKLFQRSANDTTKPSEQPASHALDYSSTQTTQPNVTSTSSTFAPTATQSSPAVQLPTAPSKASHLAFDVILFAGITLVLIMGVVVSLQWWRLLRKRREQLGMKAKIGAPVLQPDNDIPEIVVVPNSRTQEEGQSQKEEIFCHVVLAELPTDDASSGSSKPRTIRFWDDVESGGHADNGAHREEQDLSERPAEKEAYPCEKQLNGLGKASPAPKESESNLGAQKEPWIHLEVPERGDSIGCQSEPREVIVVPTKKLSADIAQMPKPRTDQPEDKFLTFEFELNTFSESSALESLKADIEAQIRGISPTDDRGQEVDSSKMTESIPAGKEMEVALDVARVENRQDELNVERQPTLTSQRDETNASVPPRRKSFSHSARASAAVDLEELQLPSRPSSNPLTQQTKHNDTGAIDVVKHASELEVKNISPVEKSKPETELSETTDPTPIREGLLDTAFGADSTCLQDEDLSEQTANVTKTTQTNLTTTTKVTKTTTTVTKTISSEAQMSSPIDRSPEEVGPRASLARGDVMLEEENSKLDFKTQETQGAPLEISISSESLDEQKQCVESSQVISLTTTQQRVSTSFVEKSEELKTNVDEAPDNLSPVTSSIPGVIEAVESNDSQRDTPPKDDGSLENSGREESEATAAPEDKSDA